MANVDPPPVPNHQADSIKTPRMQLTSSTSKSSRHHLRCALPMDFVPSSVDVICGRGKKCSGHIGNIWFQQLVQCFLSVYRSAVTKVEKSTIIGKVMKQVRHFVKQDDKGQWYIVEDLLAREKTSQGFRDALHEKYRSSNLAKSKRRFAHQLSSAIAARQMQWESINTTKHGKCIIFQTWIQYNHVRFSYQILARACPQRPQSLLLLLPLVRQRGRMPQYRRRRRHRPCIIQTVCGSTFRHHRRRIRIP